MADSTRYQIRIWQAEDIQPGSQIDNQINSGAKKLGSSVRTGDRIIAPIAVRLVIPSVPSARHLLAVNLKS